MSKLSEAEIKFVLSNYKNYTAKELTLSLNKIRRRLGEKILVARYVNELVSRLIGRNETNEVDVKVDLLQASPIKRGAPTKVHPNDSKTKALKDYLNETQEDAMCESEALTPLLREIEQELEKEIEPDDRRTGD